MKKLVAIIVILGIGLSLAACGAGAPAEPVASAEPAADAQPAQEETDGAEYAFIVKTLSNEIFQKMVDGANAKAAELGIKLDVYGANSEDDLEGQLNLMQNAVAQNYKAIAFAPISSDNLNAACAEATQKGIYLINFGEGVNLEGLKGLGGTVEAFVTQDFYQNGQLGAKTLAEMLGNQGKIGFIEGKAGTTSSENITAGVKDYLKENTQIEIVESQPADWDRTKAYDIATNYLTKHPDIVAIYCCNDTMALGAVEAAKNAGRDDLIVFGSDGSTEARASIDAGEMTASCYFEAEYMGARAVELMYNCVQEGYQIDVGKDLNYDYVPLYIYTKE